MEDSTDIFDTGLHSLFAIPPIGFSTARPDEPHSYAPPEGAINPTPIALYLPQPPADVYAALQANNLWLSAVFLADRLATHALDVAGKTVAELGAASGLPGIVAARDGNAAFVACSDYDDPDLLRSTKRNFVGALTPPDATGSIPTDDGASASDPPKNWAVLGHSWGTDPAPMLAHAPGGFDMILLADVLWSTGGHAMLLDSVAALLAPNGVVHVASGLHTGRGPVNRFYDLARGRGFTVTFREEVRWQPGGGWGPNDEGAAHSGLEEERGVVMYYTLHK